MLRDSVSAPFQNRGGFYWFLLVFAAQVDLYEVLDNRVKPWRGNLITSRLVPLYTEGWEVFNVTQMVTKLI